MKLQAALGVLKVLVMLGLLGAGLTAWFGWYVAATVLGCLLLADIVSDSFMRR